MGHYIAGGYFFLFQLLFKVSFINWFYIDAIRTDIEGSFLNYKRIIKKENVMVFNSDKYKDNEMVREAFCKLKSLDFICIIEYKV